MITKSAIRRASAISSRAPRLSEQVADPAPLIIGEQDAEVRAEGRVGSRAHP